MLEEKIVKKLDENKETISSMESCTAGYFATTLTNVDGSSRVLKFSAITYSNEYKIKMGVSEETINKYTVYSMEVAKIMAKAIVNYTLSRANKEKGICYYKDDLTPIIDKILEADTLLLGAPNYLGDVASGFRALYERLIFCVLSYDGGPSYYKGKLNIGLFYTMNAPKEYYDNFNKPTFDNYKNTFSNFFNGKVIDYPVFNTLQVNDYSKFNIAMFDEENKKESREKQFPIDLEEAFKIGAELSKGE